jgi:hypothetical protein
MAEKMNLPKADSNLEDALREMKKKKGWKKTIWRKIFRRIEPIEHSWTVDMKQTDY